MAFFPRRLRARLHDPRRGATDDDPDARPAASQKMQTPLAADLAAHDNRVVTFDFLGHGASDRPLG